MLHYYRQLRLKILNEGKSKKYLSYAFGEIILVVVGILIALQINNWNEVRKENREEQKILESLEAEYKYNELELERNINKGHDLIATADSLLAIFSESPELINEKAADRLLQKLSRYTSFDPSSGALNDLINSGRLKLIKNERLRIKLSKWNGELEDVKEDEKRLMAFGEKYLNPYRLKVVDYSPGTRFTRDISILFKDPEFENIVYYIKKSEFYIIESNYSMLNKEINEILMEIQK